MKFTDYDAFRAEQHKVSTYSVRIGGIDYPIAPSIPAIVVIDALALMRMQTDPSTQVSAEAIERFGCAIFGEDLWHDILVRHRITLVEAPDLIKFALEAYTGDPKEKAESTSTKTPSSGTSSRTGRRSKRTSSASTEST